MTLSFAFSRTTFYAAFRYAKIKMQVKCKSKSRTFIDTLSVWKFKWRVRILPPQPSKEQVLLCLFFVFFTGFEPEKVCAFRKGSGGAFSAQSARAVPHAKREVSRANSMRRRSRRRRSNPATPAKSRASTRKSRLGSLLFIPYARAVAYPFT